MRKLLKIFILATFILLANCKEKSNPKDKVKEEFLETEQSDIIDIVHNMHEAKKNNKETIEEFLEKLKTAIKTDNINFIENNILFPFYYKSGGELVDTFNSYKEIKTNDKFNAIIKARYTERCDDEINSIKNYCITYFDETIDITFYAVKQYGKFKLIRMETPN